MDASNGAHPLTLGARFPADDANRFPTGWDEMIRAGLVRGVPLDPTGVPYTLDPVSGAVDVAKDSSLYPLRRGL